MRSCAATMHSSAMNEQTVSISLRYSKTLAVTDAGADKVMFCWWKAESPEAIVETLGDMAQLFDNDIREMPNVYDFKD